MPRTILRRLAALLIVALGAAACTDSPTGANGGAVAELGFSLDLSGTSVTAMAVEVTASDIPEPLVFNIPVSNGTASGTIRVPAGSARTITVLAYDDDGHLTHQGSRTVEVLEGTNNTVAISLLPLTGDVPITVNFGSLVITITRGLTPLSTSVWTDNPGDTVIFQATVTQANGVPVTGAVVRWASLNPSVASVDSIGNVAARRSGSTEIVATYAGFAASVPFHVTGDGTNGTTDNLAPYVTSLNFSADTVDVSSDDRLVTVTVTAWDRGAGVDSMWVAVAPPAYAGHLGCSAKQSAPQGSSDEVTLSCELRFRQSGPNGNWGIATLDVFDALGNERSSSMNVIPGLDMSKTITVIGAEPDMDDPELFSMAFSADTVTAPGEVTLVVEAYDGMSGLGLVMVSLYNAATESFLNCYQYGAADGVFSCRIQVDEGTAPGEYVVTSVLLQDLSGRSKNYTATEFQELELSASVVVVN